MWFNPDDLLKVKPNHLATSAIPATLEDKNSKSELQSSKVAKVADSQELKNASAELESSKVAKVADSQESKNASAELESRKVAKVADSTESKNNSIEYNEYIEPDPDDRLTVTCYTPNGTPILVRAKDDAHLEWLLKVNPLNTRPA